MTVKQPVAMKCQVPEFPVLPDITPVALGKDPKSPAAIAFSVPDFTMLAQWVVEVADWREAVLHCPGVYTQTPAGHGVTAALDKLMSGDTQPADSIASSHR